MLRSLIALSLMLALAPSAWASDPDTAGMARVFASMKRALQTKNAKLFQKQWHALGYKKNLVGTSGLAGKQVFKQGSRKGWFLQPEMGKLRSIPGQRGAPWIVPSVIFSAKKKRAVDKVFALLIYKEKRWMLLGAGEKLAQVEALGKRYLDKKGLEPPQKGSK